MGTAPAGWVLFWSDRSVCLRRRTWRDPFHTLWHARDLDLLSASFCELSPYVTGKAQIKGLGVFFLHVVFNGILDLSHPPVQAGTGLGTVLQLGGKHLGKLLAEVLFVTHPVLQAGPEIHGNGAELLNQQSASR